MHLNFSQSRRTAGDILAIGAFGDHAFPSPLARFREVGFAFGFTVRGEAQGIGEAECRLEQSLARDQRLVPEVPAVQVEQVEQIVKNGDVRRERLPGVVDLHALLQAAEAGHIALERHDLAIHDKRFGGLFA